MAKLSVFLFLITLGAASAAQEARIDNAIRLKLGEIEKERDLQNRNIQAMEKGKISPGLPGRSHYKPSRSGTQFYFRTKDDRERAIVNARAELESGNSLAPVLVISNEMRIGDFGKLQPVTLQESGIISHSYEIAQIIDESNMLVAIDNLNLYSRYKEQESRLIWLKSSTKGVVDGTRIKLDGVYQITGTKQYTTAIGSSKTVYVIEPIDFREALARLWNERQPGGDRQEIPPKQAMEGMANQQVIADAHTAWKAALAS